MRTQKPLGFMAQELSAYIVAHEDYMKFQKRILNIFEGQLKPEIEAEMAVELSPQSFERARNRIPSFNLLSRITTKLSKVYIKPAARYTGKADKDSLELWEKWTQFDHKMSQANMMLNLHKITAVEPFIQEGIPKIRVIPAHQFLPYSDNPFDAQDMTVFLKFIKTTREPVQNYTDVDGNLTDPDELEDIGHYIAYSEDEIMHFKAGFKQGSTAHITLLVPNPLGKIPQTVISRSTYRIIPIPDSDSLNNTILIPKMYADLSYAIQMQSHGVIAMIDLDTDPGKLRKSPDAAWDFKTTDGAPKQGVVIDVKVDIDIEEVDALIQSILSIWLETRNIRAGTSTKSGEQRASGAAKIMDQADASEDIEIQKGIMSMAERLIWDKIKLVNNHTMDMGAMASIVKARTISEEFTVRTSFPTFRPTGNRIDDIAFVREKMALGIMSRKQAVKFIYPEFNDEQVNTWLKEAEDDQEFLEGITSSAGGQFGEGNQAGTGTSHNDKDMP